MKLKVHIGCGSVYLKEWINVDIRGPKTFLSYERPDLVERWQTEDDDYYGRHLDKTQDALRAGPLDQEYVCDAYGSFSNIPCQAWSVDEILARHSFEHLSLTEAHTALDQIDTVMREGGTLRIDVPDHEQSLKELLRTGDEFYIRHLLGPRRNDYGFHLMSYTRDRLKTLVEEHGFVFVEEEPNIHFYPAFCLKFVKPGPRIPYEYVQLPEMQPGWKILDIGPGNYPHPLATHYLDRNIDNLRPLAGNGKLVYIYNIENGLENIPDKEFDFVWCSHVMEHVEDPAALARHISRIGKRGTLVVPSAIKESLFHFEENEHKWLILPSPSDGPPIFIRHNAAYISKLKNSEVQAITCRLFRSGPNRTDAEQRFLRKWFYNHEVDLDVVVHWQDELKVQVIG